VELPWRSWASKILHVRRSEFPPFAEDAKDGAATVSGRRCWRRGLADRSVRPTCALVQKLLGTIGTSELVPFLFDLGGLVGCDGYGRVLRAGPGVAHAVDYCDCAEDGDYPEDGGHAVEQCSEDY
jgi:hypothetical protein